MAFMASNTGGGDFTPYVKYNAKAGRWYTKKDEQGAAEFEVTNMTAIFDMDNIRTGWFNFPTGGAPEKTFDPSLDEAAARPSENHKRGFQVDVFSEKNLLGKREFSSTAGTVIDAINPLHTDWEAGKAANPGKVPVVKCSGVLPIVGKHGTNYQPVFEIVSWTDRPAELGAPAAKSPAASPPAAKPAAHTPPPAMATAGADEPDF